MDNEHTFALFRDSDPAHGNTPEPPTEGQAGVDPRIAAALRELQQARIRPMSQDEADETLGKLSRIQSVAASLMCDVTETLAATNNEVDPAEVLRRAGKLPGSESKRMAKTAKQLSDMPNVKERFATGDITPNHVNALANAADKVGPDVVDADQTLLEAADEMPPDTFGRHARRWSEKKLIERGLDPLERQRRAREAKLWVEKDTGLGVLMAKLPRHQFEQVRQAVDRHYLHHHRQDSADGRSPDQVRTPKHRLADVVYELLTGRSALSGDIITDQIGIKAKAATQLIVTAPLEVVDGTDPDGQVDIVGVGPVPRRFLQTLSPDTVLAGMIFNRAGRTLWLGRNQRLGNAAQRLAVAIRDGGCFECGEPMHRCELHHMREWHRDQGPTDIDNLVAVCRRHHKWIETNNLIVRRTPNGYQTQPRAGPDPP
ncbi:MAG: DUF222 domain-containing protein [bacterium]|nr:DUF222 domain-containing protein [bacterium]